MNLRIDAQLRKLGKKSDNGALRRQGMIPGELYGAGTENIHLYVEKKEFTRVSRQGAGQVRFYDLIIDGKEYKAVIKEKQIHPVSREVLHIDFMELHTDKQMNLEIPISVKGEANGVKNGGVLEIHIHHLPVYTLPQDMKDGIEIDITNLEVGQGIFIRDLDLGSMTTKLSPDLPVVMVHVPKALQAANNEASASTTAEKKAE
jgi:large subunit ribosomal protein L25